MACNAGNPKTCTGIVFDQRGCYVAKYFPIQALFHCWPLQWRQHQDIKSNKECCNLNSQSASFRYCSCLVEIVSLFKHRRFCPWNYFCTVPLLGTDMSKSLMTDFAALKNPEHSRTGTLSLTGNKWASFFVGSLDVTRIMKDSRHIDGGKHWLVSVCVSEAHSHPNTDGYFAVTELQINASSIAAHLITRDVVLWCLW